MVLSKDHAQLTFEDFAGSGAHGFVDLPNHITSVLGELDMSWVREFPDSNEALT